MDVSAWKDQSAEEVVEQDIPLVHNIAAIEAAIQVVAVLAVTEGAQVRAVSAYSQLEHGQQADVAALAAALAQMRPNILLIPALPRLCGGAHPRFLQLLCSALHTGSRDECESWVSHLTFHCGGWLV